MCFGCSIDDIGEFELSAQLAEKYADFTILVKICDKTDDEDRLMYYMDKYEKKVRRGEDLNTHLKILCISHV